MNHLLTVKLTFIIKRLLQMHVYLKEAKIKLHYIMFPADLKEIS